ncbi:MAG: hypothetical protein ACREKH_19235 [Candidatus Rokuibacteriota bacterium]
MSTPAFAVVGALDNVPSASLLLPYFQVDLNNPDGVTTLLSINNASSGPAIAHVTVWTDLSVPTLAFNVFLTGYDVHTLNLRDLFTTGILPATSHSNTTISPRGTFSSTTNPVSGVGPGSTTCNGQLPLPPLDPAQLAHIRAAHTGQGSAIFGGLCTGVDFGDNIARGYITVDNANFCTLRTPVDAATGYFIAGGLGDANNINQLWGDFFYVDPGNNFAQGESLVHLEADPSLGAANYTFYRRYAAGGQDQREGLATTWAARYLNGGAFTGGTDLIVWRDAKRTINPFSCALVAPAPFPLSHNQIVAFDEQETPDIPEPPAFFPPVPNDPIIIPWEANLVQVGGPDLPVAFNFGWLYLNLNTAVAGSQVPFEPITQNWVGVIHNADGRFSVGHGGVSFDNVTDLLKAKDCFIGFGGC